MVFVSFDCCTLWVYSCLRREDPLVGKRQKILSGHNSSPYPTISTASNEEPLPPQLSGESLPLNCVHRRRAGAVHPTCSSSKSFLPAAATGGDEFEEEQVGSLTSPTPTEANNSTYRGQQLPRTTGVRFSLGVVCLPILVLQRVILDRLRHCPRLR